MKRHLFKIAAFFLIVVLLDLATGMVLSRLTGCARGGDTARNEYICNKTREDILVFGSSRAIHHYNPLIIADSLGLTCYNCGQDGNGAILNYGRYHLISQRYHPKVVIYDVMPLYDLLTGEDNRKFLGWLRPYYDRPGIDSVFAWVDPMEKYKMMSRMYRYNSRFLQILSDCVRPAQEDALKGFQPIEGTLDTLKINPEVIESPQLDSLKISCLKRMIDETDATRFVFVVSPYWYGMDDRLIAPLRDLCRQRGILLLDFSNDPKYVHNDDYFIDGVHLNARGADEFTRDLVKRLRQVCAEVVQDAMSPRLAAISFSKRG